MIDLSISLSDLEFFLLILTRVASFIFVAPFYSTKGVPNRVKIAISVFVAYFVYKMVPFTEFEYNTILMYAIIVIKEAFTGLIIGFGANICMAILNFAGHVNDMETGLSMVTLIDPMSNESVTITGSYYTYTVTLMLMITGMYQYVLAALVESFNLIPINGAVFSTDKLAAAIIEFMVDYLSIGFRICLPIVCVMLLLNTILGVLAKVSPQLNMFAVGMQIKVLAGLGTMFLVVGLLPSVSTMIFSEMKKMVTIMIEAVS